MSNRILAVEAVQKEQRLGWPFGAGDAYKYVPALLGRIQELENALSPFAMVAVKNMAVPPANGLQEVYFKDLMNALEMMDSARSSQVSRETFFDVPAE